MYINTHTHTHKRIYVCLCLSGVCCAAARRRVAEARSLSCFRKLLAALMFIHAAALRATTSKSSQVRSKKQRERQKKNKIEAQSARVKYIFCGVAAAAVSAQHKSARDQKKNKEPK